MSPYADPALRRRYAREWAAARRAAWIEANGPCARCGSSQDLEVDHIDPGTKVSHRVWSWSAQRRNKELAKCQVLCRSCHAAKSGGERARDVEHGHPHTYGRLGCRCDLCRGAAYVYKKGGRPFLERWIRQGRPMAPADPAVPCLSPEGPAAQWRPIISRDGPPGERVS